MIIFVLGVLAKSGSESSLSDAAETTSTKESSRIHEEKETCSDNEENVNENIDYPSNDPPDNCKLRTESSSTRVDSLQNEWERTPSIQSQEEEKTECDTQLEEARQLQKQGAVILRRKSRGNPLFRKSEGNDNEVIVMKLSQYIFFKFFQYLS